MRENNVIFGMCILLYDVKEVELLMMMMMMMMMMQHMKFDNIRVASPVMLVVNGRKLSSSCQAASQLKLSTFSE